MTEIILRKQAVALGLTHYFTGIACKNGHICERKTKKSLCLLCSRMHGATQRKTDKYKKYIREYKNKTKSTIYRKQETARRAIQKAVYRGKVERKPCERCGEIKVHAHHEDYSKPLEVMWLCHEHHLERHRELKAMASDPTSFLAP